MRKEIENLIPGEPTVVTGYGEEAFYADYKNGFVWILLRPVPSESDFVRECENAEMAANAEYEMIEEERLSDSLSSETLGEFLAEAETKIEAETTEEERAYLLQS